MNSPVEQIKERLSIQEVVSSYLKLEPAGSNLRARCPFHNEKTPSFFVSPGRNSYYCFGCGAKGDIFSFVEEFEGLDFKGALELLALKAGVVLERYNKKQETEKEKLIQAMEKSTLFFESNLEKNKEAKKYLEERGLSEETIKKFRIGFALESWDSLYKFLKNGGFNDGEILRAGLTKEGERGYYDRFRSRIVFPISDSSGRVIAFSGRIFGVEAEKNDVAKYLNSPETPLFSKSMVLYGLDKAKDSIRRSNFSILVEGQMDLVMSHQAGFRNTVATSGTALSENLVSKEEAVSNLGLVRRLSENIVLAFDADSAGFKAIEKAGRIALMLGMDVKVAEIPEGYDPADLILREGEEAWKVAVRNSKHVIDFVLGKIMLEEKDERKALRRIKEELLSYVAIIPSAIEQGHFLKKISEVSGISELLLMEDLKKVSISFSNEKAEIEAIDEASKKMFRRDYIERRLFGIIFWQESLQEKKIDVNFAKKELSEILGMDFSEVANNLEKEKADFIFEAEVFYEEGVDVEKEFLELLSNLKEEYLKEQLLKKMRELRTTEVEKDPEKSEKILKECQIISQKIEEIKRNRLKK